MIIFTFIGLLLDIVSKVIISKYISYGKSISVIKNFFNITYVKNTGAAWSILSDNSFLVLIISAVIILGIIVYIYKNKPKHIIEEIGYSLILAGAIGNFTNRVMYGYVIDFIDFKIFGYDFPIFNLADIFIVIGVVLLAIYTWRISDGNKSIRK